MHTLWRASESTKGDTTKLHAAVAACKSALLVYTRERAPLDWARTKNNLGAALKTLGDSEGDTALLLAAVAAYEDALQENTRDRVPLVWGVIRYNLALAELAIAAQMQDIADETQAEVRARAAQAHVEAALTVFDPLESAFYHETVTRLRDHLRGILG